ncbi:MAG: topoisomerase C-terminal repeat-containing protein, partial [Kofleriaceae bacterium]
GARGRGGGAPGAAGTGAAATGGAAKGGAAKGGGAKGGAAKGAAAKGAAVVELVCPRCRIGKLLAGARGWGCARWREGCGFVVWFETAGRRLSAAQLRDLVTRGRTRKARFAPERGVEIEGRLVLDPARDGGAARFEPERAGPAATKAAAPRAPRSRRAARRSPTARS